MPKTFCLPTNNTNGHVTLRNDPSAIRAVAGQIERISIVNKFGHDPSVTTTLAPLCVGGTYRTPTVATTLRIKAGGDANDTVAGTGARQIKLQGLDETGAPAEETIDTAGASASSPTTTTFIRLYRVTVTESGTYATQSAGSHADDIVIEDGAGTEDWATLDSHDLAHSQSQIGAYTIPLGYTGYIHAIQLQTAATKVVNVFLMQRPGILTTSAPFPSMIIVREFVGIEGDTTSEFVYPLGPFDELTDLIFMARVASGTAAASVDFVIVLTKNM